MGDHNHDFGVPPGYVDPYGRDDAGDVALLGRFVGAAFDGCTTCQDAELTLIVSDPGACARLVELACTAVVSRVGGLPSGMTDPDVTGVASLEFRKLAAALKGGDHRIMFEVCRRMAPTGRRAAANSAADTLVGLFSIGG